MVATEKNPLPVLATRIAVSDGKQETAVEPRAAALPPGTPQPKEDVTLRAYELPLFQGVNTVRIVAVNAAGESEPQEVSITHNGEGALDKRGSLWVLAVGVDKYPGAKKITDAEQGRVSRILISTMLAPTPRPSPRPPPPRCSLAMSRRT